MTMLGVLRGPRQVLFGAGQRHALGTVTAALGSPCARLHRCPLQHHDRVRRAGRDSSRTPGCTSPRSPRCCPTSRSPRCTSAPTSRPASDPDVIVGIGGGSRLDLAKALALLLAHGGEASDYYGEFRVPGPRHAPWWPSDDGGDGFGVTPVAVITDPERVSKVGISSPYLIPAVALCGASSRSAVLPP